MRELEAAVQVTNTHLHEVMRKVLLRWRTAPFFVGGTRTFWFSATFRSPRTTRLLAMAISWVDPTTRRRRQLRLTGALPRIALARGRRASVCAAAGLLTAVGARVEVRAPEVAWPRPDTGRLVVANRVGALDGLALRTVVPDVVEHPEGPSPTGRLGRFRAEPFRDAAVSGTPVCPVAVRYRTEEGGNPAALLAGDDLGTAIRRAVEIHGLVIEVHLLPALSAGDGEPHTLAILAEYAIAARLDRMPSVPPPDSRRSTGRPTVWQRRRTVG